jgi:uncharacterized protein YcbK (DUF882 family)
VVSAQGISECPMLISGAALIALRMRPASYSVMHTTQQEETENDRDSSRIVETLATLGEIFRKTGRHKLKKLDHFKEDDYSMAITVGVRSSPDMGVSTRMRA